MCRYAAQTDRGDSDSDTGMCGSGRTGRVQMTLSKREADQSLWEAGSHLNIGPSSCDGVYREGLGSGDE